MAKSAHKGSCHCGAVVFEAEFDPELIETVKCNCTSCLKNRFWSLFIGLDDFRVISGAGLIEGRESLSMRCPSCGVLTFVHQNPTEWNPEPSVQVSVASFDDLTPSQMSALKVSYVDGRNDTWEPVKGETGYL